MKGLNDAALPCAAVRSAARLCSDCRAALCPVEAQAMTIFEQVDTDNNGVLDREELLAAMNMLQKAINDEVWEGRPTGLQRRDSRPGGGETSGGPALPGADSRCGAGCPVPSMSAPGHPQTLAQCMSAVDAHGHVTCEQFVEIVTAEALMAPGSDAEMLRQLRHEKPSWFSDQSLLPWA